MATDRHTGIRKMMREQYPGIQHQFDVWHLIKAIKKRLTKISKRKDCADIGPWIKSITNHVWWSTQHCDKDPEKLVEMVQSVTHHIYVTSTRGTLERSSRSVPMNRSHRRSPWKENGSHQTPKLIKLFKRSCLTDAS